MSGTDFRLCLVEGFVCCGVEPMGSANEGSFIEIWCQDCIYLKNGQHLATVLRMSMVYMCVCCLCAGVVCTVIKIMPYQFWQFLWLQYVLYLQSDYFIQMSVLPFVSGFYFKNFLKSGIIIPWFENWSFVRCYITLTGNYLLVDMAWHLRRLNDTPLTASNLESPKCLILCHLTLWSIFPLEKL
jgi:hypothetical protein